jgi:hypothetical protein
MQPIHQLDAPRQDVNLQISEQAILDFSSFFHLC